MKRILKIHNEICVRQKKGQAENTLELVPLLPY